MQEIGASSVTLPGQDKVAVSGLTVIAVDAFDVQSEGDPPSHAFIVIEHDSPPVPVVYDTLHVADGDPLPVTVGVNEQVLVTSEQVKLLLSGDTLVSVSRAIPE